MYLLERKAFEEKVKQVFQASRKQEEYPCRLIILGKITSHKDVVLDAWASHFNKLFQSRVGSEAGLQQLQSKIEHLAAASFQNDEQILDCPFTVDEIKGAVKSLKRGKSNDPDGLSADHRVCGGGYVLIWLCSILNAIRDLEDILKLGVISPVYKVKGKDPYAVDSYRPITVTSTLSKVLELVLLQRMELTLREARILHLNQTAYRRNVGCADGIVSTQEAILRYIHQLV